jgi:hypothetical protein
VVLAASRTAKGPGSAMAVERGSEERGAAGSAARECISCGKPIDLGVYFTMCPHCGFNYRIEITPVKPGIAASRRSETFLYAVSIVVPMAGFVTGALLSKEMDSQSRKLANGCVALGAINIIVTPILILRYFGLA